MSACARHSRFHPDLKYYPQRGASACETKRNNKLDTYDRSPSRWKRTSCMLHVAPAHVAFLHSAHPPARRARHPSHSCGLWKYINEKEGREREVGAGRSVGRMTDDFHFVGRRRAKPPNQARGHDVRVRIEASFIIISLISFVLHIVQFWPKIVHK